MPYTTKQADLLRAIKHGFKPDRAMSNVSKGAAARMLAHGKNKAPTAARHLARTGGRG